MVPRAATAAVLAVVVAPAGCGGAWYERPLAGLRGEPDRSVPFERPVPCGSGPWPSRIDAGMRHDALRIGSVPFYGLGYHHGPGRFSPGAPPLTVVFAVPPRSRVIVAVPPGQRAVAGVDGSPSAAPTPARAHRALRCVTSGVSAEFTASFVVSGPRCVPVAVTIDRVTTTRTVAFGRRRC